MKIDLTSIDLDAFADLDVWFATIAMMLAFGMVMVVRHDLKRRSSPVERLARSRHFGGV